MELRKQIDHLLAQGDSQAAFRALAELWRCESGPAAAGFVNSRFQTLRPHLALTPYRLAILRSFTVEPLVPLLRAAAFTSGIDLSIHLGDFNAYAQEILEEASPLYQFAPDLVILAVQTSDLAPELCHDYTAHGPPDHQAAIQRVDANFRDWVRAFRGRSSAHLLLHNLESNPVPSHGVLDCQSVMGQSAAIHQINQQLSRLAAESKGVYILDYDALIARHGRLHWRDQRKWLTVRLPIAAAHLLDMTQEWLRFLHPLTGKIAKALVVDLDNTLWGGVIGEDGLAGIQLGLDYPGAAYQALQRAMLDLARRGILLAVCSKNNSEDAMEALSSHPGMLLRPPDFAALRINWTDKAENLRQIAVELNIGVDSLAFLDDNPVERQQVREQLPGVTVIELPPDPACYAQALRDCPVFERLSLSEEDLKRRQFYAIRQQQALFERSCSTSEDFYRSLLQEAEVALLRPATLARVAQLTQKTNQFNLTTRRYSEQQIADLAARPGWQVLSLRVKDRYVDNGLVGVAITEATDGVCRIDTLLLSCRVIGRTLETAFLACLVEKASGRGFRQVEGWFLPTKKNAPARDFYSRHGFQLVSQDGEASRWVIDLASHSVACPAWIRLIAPRGDEE